MAKAKNYSYGPSTRHNHGLIVEHYREMNNVRIAEDSLSWDGILMQTAHEFAAADPNDLEAVQDAAYEVQEVIEFILEQVHEDFQYLDDEDNFPNEDVADDDGFAAAKETDWDEFYGERGAMPVTDEGK